MNFKSLILDPLKTGLGQGAIAVVLVVLGYFFFIREDNGLVVGQMPECNSKFARELLMKAVHDSPLSKTTGLKILKLGDVVDFLKDAPKPPEDHRVCNAQAFTNAGKKMYMFSIKWVDEDKDEVYLEVMAST